MKRDKDIIALTELLKMAADGPIPIAKSHKAIRSTAIGHCSKCGRQPAGALASAAETFRQA